MTKPDTKITSDVQLISSLLYSGQFKVPWHQRSYDWGSKKKDEVGDLLNDLKDAFDANRECYFLGSIMLLKAEGTEPRKINDGQQRLVTFSLIMAAFARLFRGRDTSRESRAVETLFDRPRHKTSCLDDASRYHPRIDPPRNDRDKYSKLIRGHEIGSNGLLRKAWRKINPFIQSLDRETEAGFFDFLMQRVEVSVLDVPRGVDANQVFETLNARGKVLEEVDLIRNLLYSHFADEGEDSRRNIVHAHLERLVEVFKVGKQLSEYFRCCLQCRYGPLSEGHLHRDVRNKIEVATSRVASPDYVFDLVAELGREDSQELFRMIKFAKTGDLKELLPKIPGKRDLTVLLHEMKTYTVSHPLCFALLHRFISEDDPRRRREMEPKVARSLKNLTSFIMRSVFATSQSGFRPYKIAKPIADCAARVFAGSDLASLDIMDDLIQADNNAFHVIKDASFQRSMTEMRLRNSNKAVQYLFSINAHRQAGSDALTIGGCSLEHVLPQSDSHRQGWVGFENEDAEDLVHRIGNFTLLSQRENQGGDAFNASFDAKKPFFAKSPFLMTREIAERYEYWTPGFIKQRSRQLAEEAARIWSFSHAG